MKKKLIPISSLRSSADTVLSRQRLSVELGRNTELLSMCCTEWNNLRTFRNNRNRAMQYTYGDQWSDIIYTQDGSMSEKAYIQSKGNIPLANNLIRRLVNTVSGSYTKQQTEPVCTARDKDEQQLGEMMSITLQYNWQINKMRDVLTTQFEEFLVSGMAISRETCEMRNGKRDVYTDIINPNYIFFSSTMTDPRHWDISMIGQIHDIPYRSLIAKFSSSSQDIPRLNQLYRSSGSSISDITDRHNRNTGFYAPVDNSLCRVFEVWTQENKPRYWCHDWLDGSYYKSELSELPAINAENQSRLADAALSGIPTSEVPLIDPSYFVDNYWFYQFLAPDGTILEEGESPFSHQSHPYTIKLYPFVNGEIHSFVSDFIDQQRYINRMITLNDFILRSSAKGVTMIDKRSIPDGMTPEEFAEQWVEYDGCIFYDGKSGANPPQQISKNLTNIGTTEMLQLQLRLMEDIAGVHGAMQGKTPHSGTSAALYAQQAANGSTSIMSLLTKFSSFENELAVKKTKMIQQYYTDKMVVNIAGSGYSSVRHYDPEMVRDTEFDLAITEGTATPAYRMLANDQLMEFFRMGAISIEMLLENSTLPFAAQLLQTINTAKEQAQQSGQIPPMDFTSELAQLPADNQLLQEALKSQ